MYILFIELSIITPSEEVSQSAANFEGLEQGKNKHPAHSLFAADLVCCL